MRNVRVERQALVRGGEEAPLDALPAARAPGFSRARVADEEQLRLEVELPDRHSRVNAAAQASTARRTPFPIADTSGVTRSAGSPVFGSTVIVVPRASFE